MDLNKHCLICCKQVTSHFIFDNITLCKDCYNRFPFIYKTIKIENVKCHIIYEYNDFIKEIIYRIKGLYDKELSQVLLSPIKIYLRLKYLFYNIIPIPSTIKSDNKRGFNHVKEIFKILNLPIIDCLSKTKNYKQSSQSKYNRSNINKIMSIDPTSLSPKKQYLLVDDITTTHQSLLAAIDLLHQNNIKHIKILIIACRLNT